MAAKSWVSPKTIRNQPSGIAGVGFFATQAINKGEVIAIKSGHIIDRAKLDDNRDVIRDSEMQITDDLYLAPLTQTECNESMISMNHSCEPNVGVAGDAMFVAIRDIESGSEITFDYAMHRSEPDYSMECACQKAACRNIITGNDWRIPELQEKYRGYFSWYIQQKIDVLSK